MPQSVVVVVDVTVVLVDVEVTVEVVVGAAVVVVVLVVVPEQFGHCGVTGNPTVNCSKSSSGLLRS